MARDKGMEALLDDELADEPGITQKAMFGGWAWLVNGNLLCGARHDGMLVRLGKGLDGWALDMPGIVPMMSVAGAWTVGFARHRTPMATIRCAAD